MSFAVAGRSCINPIAPAELFAFGSRPDSWKHCAAMRSQSKRYSSASSFIQPA
jgi:hypothetical protein